MQSWTRLVRARDRRHTSLRPDEMNAFAATFGGFVDRSKPAPTADALTVITRGVGGSPFIKIWANAALPPTTFSKRSGSKR